MQSGRRRPPKQLSSTRGTSTRTRTARRTPAKTRRTCKIPPRGRRRTPATRSRRNTTGRRS
eukprot:1988711-Pleurochrysis_carterae.AAC.1